MNKNYLDALDEIMQYCDWWIKLYESSEYPYPGMNITIPYVCVRAQAKRLKEAYERDLYKEG